MSTDVYLDFWVHDGDPAHDRGLAADGEVVRIGHLGILSLGPLYDEFVMTQPTNPIMTQDVLDRLSNYIGFWQEHMSFLNGLKLEDFDQRPEALVQFSSDPFDDPRDDETWDDWLDPETFREEVAPYIGMRWRVRVD